MCSSLVLDISMRVDQLLSLSSTLLLTLVASIHTLPLPGQFPSKITGKYSIAMTRILYLKGLQLCGGDV